MLILLNLIIVTTALIYLSLAITRNYALVTKNRAQSMPRGFLNTIGLLLLLASLILAISWWGALLGTVYWCANLTLAALLCCAILSFKPHYMRLFLVSFYRRTSQTK